MSDLYVYYRVARRNRAALLPRVDALLAALAYASGVAGQLKYRPTGDGGDQTWMEVYPAIPAGFDAVLAAAVVDAGLAGLIDGPRHSEIFMDLIPCV